MLIRDEEGVSAVEYGLLVALIAVVIIAAVTLLGGTIQSFLVTGGKSDRHITTLIVNFFAPNLIVGSPSTPINNSSVSTTPARLIQQWLC